LFGDGVDRDLGAMQQPGRRGYAPPGQVGQGRLPYGRSEPFGESRMGNPGLPGYADAGRGRRAEAFIINGLRTGALTPIVDRTLDLTDIVEAHRYLESNQQAGKVVVTVRH
jgi:hypothetical protein